MYSSRFVRRLLISLMSIVAIILGTVGVASQAQAAASRTWTVYVGSQSPSGQIQGMAFATPDISINVGDTIHYVVKSMEPHTVSFTDASCPANGFDFSKTCMFAKTATSISAPGEFRSSGILSTEATDLGPAVTSWDLTFTGVGDYAYVCYLHGFEVAPGHYVGMAGKVHVRAAGTPYPQTQNEIDAAYHQARSAAIDDGNTIWDAARDASTPHHIFVGASDDMAMVMAFIKQRAVINVGESITFDTSRNHAPVPHTVTIDTEPGSVFDVVGTPTNYTGGTLSSGILIPPGFGAPLPSTFTVTFNKAGTYDVYCMLHDGMGMVATIVVH